MVFKSIAKLFGRVPDNRDIKILVIEDNEVDQRVALAAIDRGGYTSFQASTGQHGLDLAIALQPDLIILDYNLPDINGPEVCKRLKRHHATTNIPVLFLTSMDSPGSIVNCYEQGAVNYLAKPIDPKFLLKQVELALKDRKINP